MQKFQGLEQLHLNVWDLSIKLPKQLTINFLQYVYRISKYALHIHYRDKNTISEMVTDFMGCVAGNIDTPNHLNARLGFEIDKGTDFF